MKIVLLTILTFMITYCNHSEPEGSRESQAQYIVNREPLQPNPYIELPLGSIQARGWLLEMLERQRSGITSSLDELYPQVMGIRNGWLGGDGDQWERGPYWIDGLLPLAYLLDDADLKSKVQPWIEWTLSSQREDGFFGPSTDFSYEKGVQRSNSKDWWPRMVMLKVLCQYYSATADERVISFMTNYFRYQLNTLPQTPLGNWTFWAEYRACENLQAVLWLYNITGDGWLLDLARRLHSQSIDYTHIFLDTDNMKKTASIHGVNLAQGLKEPVIYWQVQADEKYLNAVKKGLQDIRDYNGIPNGMFGADELLHGNNPTQGSELCTAVELMYSLEQMIRITGDTEYADLLEKIAYNALPAQISDDFTSRQYFQQANQVLVTRNIHNFDINHGETDLVFGLLTGYPCCTSNLHQGWPKFTGNLWYATPEGGLAALTYAPSQVRAMVCGGTEVQITEDTHYPMDGHICLTVNYKDKTTKAIFPLKLRIPSWSKGALLTVNGEPVSNTDPGTIAVIDRIWQDGDKVELTLPMEVSIQEWYECSVSVERGPLVFALKIGEEWVRKEFEDPASIYGKTYWEVYPLSKWNYGLMKFDRKNPSGAFEVLIDKEKMVSDWYWNPESAPVIIKAKAKEIPSWQLYNHMAGPLPYGNMTYGLGTEDLPVETVTLIPYGCTTLRISEFPVINEKD
ncbi:MAG: beta-L-arabinofuranosidase domain-containing protein [Bacteroidales bacterium]